MSAGAERLRGRSDALAFVLPLVLAWATFDFGKSLTHVGAQKHIIETGRLPHRPGVDILSDRDRFLPIGPTATSPFLWTASYPGRGSHADSRRFGGLRRCRSRPARRRQRRLPVSSRAAALRPAPVWNAL